MQDRATDAQIERACDRGEVLRTHVMRPTWHFVTPDDIRWLLELTAPRVHRQTAPYKRHLELDARTLGRAIAVVERALRDGRHRTRAELSECLRRSNLHIAGMRLALVTMHAELEGIICSGPRRGKQFTYALLAERAPQARRLGRDEALGELSHRYFVSHGPATVRDFAWWSGLTIADTRRGLDINRARSEQVSGVTYWCIDAARPRRRRPESPAHLLPIFDEYLVAYRDREAVPHGPRVITPASRRPVIFRHAVVMGGDVAGTWRTPGSAGGTSVETTLLRRPTSRERGGLAHAACRYERFRGIPMELSISC
jgi:hypothetical protein